MAIIVPAILEADKEKLESKLFAASRISGVTTLQIDFCDGNFVEGKSVPIKEVDVLNPAFTWEAHLMVQEPVDFLDYQMVGFKRLIVHYESFSSEKQLEEAIDQITKLGMEVVIAINPETPVSNLRYFTDTIKQFTLLSVNPGKQGNPFIEQSVERVKELRAIAPHAIIEVDGGVNVTHAPVLSEAGADMLAVGSALFDTDQVQESYDALVSAATHIVAT